MGEDVDAGGDVFGGGVFVGMMGEAVAAADEDHADGHDGSEDDAVVTGTAGDDSVFAGDGCERTEKLVGELGVAVGGVVALDDAPAEFELAFPGDAGEGGFDVGFRLVADGVVGVADVDGEGDFLGDAVRDVGRDGGLADGGDEGRGVAGDFFDSEDGFGGSGEGVASEVHGSCSGVVGVSGDGGGETGLPHDAGDDAGGFVGFFEDAALFDVEFDVAEGGAGRVAEDLGLVVPAEGGEDKGEGLAFRVFAVEGAVIKFADDAAAAEIGGLEADSFFVREGEEVNRKGEGDLLFGENFEGGEGADDAEGAIILSGVDDGVDVGAEEKGRGVGIAAGEDAAHGAVFGVGGGHAESFHPVEDGGGGAEIGKREEGTDQKVGVVGQLAEFFDAFERELVRSGHSVFGSEMLAAAIGGVGEGGAEEGDVVGLVGLGFEVDLDDLKKGRVDAEAAEVVADGKEESVAASGWVGEKRVIAAAVAVRSGLDEEFVGGVEELDGNALGGFAVGGVEDVGADFLHGNISADGGPNSKEGVWLLEEPRRWR